MPPNDHITKFSAAAPGPKQSEGQNSKARFMQSKVKLLSEIMKTELLEDKSFEEIKQVLHHVFLFVLQLFLRSISSFTIDMAWILQKQNYSVRSVDQNNLWSTSFTSNAISYSKCENVKIYKLCQLIKIPIHLTVSFSSTKRWWLWIPGMPICRKWGTLYLTDQFSGDSNLLFHFRFSVSEEIILFIADLRWKRTRMLGIGLLSWLIKREKHRTLPRRLR